MIDKDFIDTIIKRLGDSIPPSLQAFKSDLERNFRVTLHNTFDKLQLVTREEFEVQQGVLAKTRAKVAALEKQLELLEKNSLQHPVDKKKK